MTRSEELSHWRDEINLNLPSLSKPQAGELALWSIGMILAHSAALNKVTLAVYVWLAGVGQTFGCIWERLRDWYRPSSSKAGHKRAEVDPDRVFPDLFAWVVRLLSTGDTECTKRPERLVLALDATTMKNHVTILCVSILIGSSAIPIAWRCVAGNQKGEWNQHWLALLQIISAAVPTGTEIIVLTDRGIWSQLIFGTIKDLGWYPLMRVNAKYGSDDAQFRREGDDRWCAMSSFAPTQGGEVRVTGEAFVSRPVPCTLIIFWGESAKEPWYLLTDVPVLPSIEGKLYAERMWIEHQFKTIKSNGWHADKSRITEPDRVARMWLAYAVAMLWAMSVGSQPIEDLDRLDRTEESDMPNNQHDNQAEANQECSQKRTSEPTSHDTTRNEQVKNTFSWFLRGVTILADRIARAIKLECPRFYCPANDLIFDTS